jgi:hypothetical protein
MPRIVPTDRREALIARRVLQDRRETGKDIKKAVGPICPRLAASPIGGRAARGYIERGADLARASALSLENACSAAVNIRNRLR